MLAPKCATCPKPVVRRKGSRGPLPKSCDACRERMAAERQERAEAAAAKPRPEPPAVLVLSALEAELGRMPEQVQRCTEAAAARSLARQMDQGLLMVSASKELSRLLALLRAMAPPERPAAAEPATGERDGEVPSGVADLRSRVRKRRTAAAG